ncbi:MAG: SpoIIE family protein phosphatase [Bacteroidales bacterium]|nr:SpoIIE family protein phosphatase [Bacteroidales bacterium]HRX30608.1 SpoIIE family protein phosphatase [Tenuifilaceae bacterium]
MYKNIRKLVGLCLLLWLIPIATLAQKGSPFITNFELPTESTSGNIGFAQDAKGVVYILVQNRVFSFDGQRWILIPMQGQPLAIDFIDNVFVAGDRLLGYFKTNNKGISIFKEIEGGQKDVFYKFFHFEKNLYVLGLNGIYRVSRVEPCSVSSYYAEKDSGKIFTDIFNVGEKLFAIKNYNQLYQVARNDARAIPSTLKDDEEFSFSFKHNGLQVLGTSKGNIYSFDGNSFKQLKFKDQQFINDCFVTGGVSVNSRTIAFSTLIGGVIILDSESGDTKYILNLNSGLPDDEVIAMNADIDGGIWLFHGMGISRVDINLPVKSFSHFEGLKGNIFSVAEYNGELYAGTNNGLYSLEENKKYETVTIEQTVRQPVKYQVPSTVNTKSGDELDTGSKTKKGLFARLFGSKKTEEAITDEKPTEIKQTVKTKKVKRKVTKLVSTSYLFKKIDGVEGKVSNLINRDGRLIIGSATGLYTLSKGKVKPILSGVYVNYIYFPDKKSYGYIAGGSSVYKIKLSPEDVSYSYVLSLPNQKVLSVSEISDKELMLTTDNKIYHIDISVPSGNLTEVSVGNNKFFSPIALRMEGNITVATPNGFYDYYSNGDSISLSQTDRNVQELKIFNSGFLPTWIKQGNTWSTIPQTRSLKQLAGYLGLLDNVNYINLSDSGDLWVVNNHKQIYRISPIEVKDSVSMLHLSLQRVVDKSGNILNSKYASIDAENNALTVELEAPFYLKERGVEYQFLLTNLMPSWSEWMDKSKIDFPFIPSGERVLKLRAKDAMGNISPVYEYQFYVSPPFYQTLWFYLFIMAAMVLFVFVFIKLRERKLLKEKRVLEQKVRERTKTIEEQKKAIEEQRDELKVRNSEILQQKEEIEAQRDEIVAQRDQIISQNKDIIKSISYARRIQTAVMPGKEKADKILGDYFILLKPRDIVSGDFYWMAKKSNKIVVIAADCTGHGVPGAFMSLLGITLLDEVVNSSGDIMPHLILNNLRAYLKRALSQVGKEHEAKDGMDVALSVIDKENGKVFFAGAYNPLYIIRNSELLEFKADKMPVGIHVNEKESFTLHEIQIQKNDCLYMFSDGYVDQFGGDNSRKFMAKNFKELLVNISSKSMEEQQAILEDTIDKWMGGNDQVDDILVMGIRI